MHRLERRALRIGCAFVLILLCTVVPATAARCEDDGLKPVAEALATVRATPAVNTKLDAGPELTPVKDRLRAWIEQKLSTLAEDGDQAALAKQMNDALVAADLTCKDSAPASQRCLEKMLGDQTQEDDRGYLGPIELSSLEYGRYLAVETEVGIRCGFDQSLYLYEMRDKHWRLLLKSERDDYAEAAYNPQNFLRVAVSPADVGHNEPAPPPLVLTLGFSPWCSSNWQSLYTRLWRASPSDLSPRPLIDTNDFLYIGDDPAVAEGSVTQHDALIEFRTNSIDGDVLIRPAVRHYLIHEGDRIERIAPLALNPADFVDEWLTTKWSDVAAWPQSGGDRAALAKWHRSLGKTSLFGQSEAPPSRCRADPALWQVALAFDLGDDKTFRLSAPVYFLVRWTAPYRFTLVQVQRRKFPRCDRADPMPDNPNELFPLQDWRR